MITVRTRKIILAVGIVLLVVVGVIHLTDFCRLEAVTLDGEPVENWSAEFGMDSTELIVSQPLDSIVDALLADEDIHRVDIRYAVPDGIEIITNNFKPAAFVLSERTGKMYGLDSKARVVPLKADVTDWERPLLVNARTEKLFEPCADVRAAIVLEQLEMVRDEYEDLYRLITEIDFVNSDYLVVTVKGLPYKLWLTAARLHEQMDDFVRFIDKYEPDLEDVKLIDIRFDDMIVCSVKD